MVHPAHPRANVSMPAGLLARGSLFFAAFSPLRAMACGKKLAAHSCGGSFGFWSEFPFQPLRATVI
jgi:hypothetical protein